MEGLFLSSRLAYYKLGNTAEKKQQLHATNVVSDTWFRQRN